MNIDELIAGDREEIRRRIATAEDPAQLTAWYRGAHAQCEDIRDDVASFRLCGTADQDWLRRASGRLAALTKVRRWAEERLLELGATPPWPASDPKMRQIRNLEDKNRRLVAALRAAGLEIPA